MTFWAIQQFGLSVRCRDIFTCESINVKSFVAEDWFAHLGSIVYEYGFAEYEYGEMQTPRRPERPTSAGTAV